MADVRIALAQLLRKYRDDTQVDALKEGAVLLVQALMEAEVTEKTGAERYKRTPAGASVPERVPPQAVGHPGGLGDAEGPQGSPGELLPEPA